MNVKSFDPISKSDCEILILGTMPGAESLNKYEYYGHPDNVFWDIIIRVLIPKIAEEDVEKISYTERMELLKSKKIALWDVLKFCDRKGSLDNSIKNEIKNDFESFFENHVNIKTILFNGQKAEKYFKACFLELEEDSLYNKIILPSTSPSHPLNTFKKLSLWKNAIINPHNRD
jgi:hypoxanthine-DNA glycosylase